MALSGTLSIRYMRGDAVEVSQSLTGEGDLDLDVTIPKTTTDKEITWSMTRAAATFLMISSDKALTIKTNSSSVPDDTIVLAAGIPLIWQDGTTKDGSDLPLFDVDITKLYVTNASDSDAASLKIRGLRDATP